LEESGENENSKNIFVKNCKCVLANKHVTIIRDLPEKKKLMIANHLTDSCSKSYLAVLVFWMQKSEGPTLLTHEKYLAVSVEFCSVEVWLFPSPVFAEQFPQAT